MSWNSWTFRSSASIKAKTGFSTTQSARRDFVSISEANRMHFLILLSGFRKNPSI